MIKKRTKSTWSLIEPGLDDYLAHMLTRSLIWYVACEALQRKCKLHA